MEGNLTNRSFVLLLLLVFASSCCKEEHPSGGGAIPPLWSTNLILGSFPFADNDGVVGYPKYGDDLIFHTTLYEDDDYTQDNRLVGLNAETGAIKWIFPKDTTQRYNYVFHGKGYLYGDHLVVKNVTSTGHPKRKNELLGINLRTLEFDWKIDLTAIEGDNNPNVCGYVNYAYNVESNDIEESRLFRTDVVTGDTTTMLRITATKQQNIVFLNLGGISIVDGVARLMVSEFYGVEDHWKPGKPAAKKIFRSLNLLTGEFSAPIEIADNSGMAMRGFVHDNIFLWDVGRKMYCIDILTNKILWTYSYPTHTLSEIIVCDGVALGIGGNEYFGVELSTGKELYSKERIGNSGTSATDGRVVYMRILGKLWVIDPRSGNKIAELISIDHNADGSFMERPVIHGDRMYLMSAYKAYCYTLYPWQ